MGIVKLFQMNPQAETEGVWISYGPNTHGEEERVKIARAGGANSRYERVHAVKMKPVRRELELGTLDNATANAIYADILADTVVLDWENVEDAAGNAIPYSRQAARKLLTEMPDFCADIRLQASRLEPFRAHLEPDAKN